MIFINIHASALEPTNIVKELLDVFGDEGFGDLAQGIHG